LISRNLFFLEYSFDVSQEGVAPDVSAVMLTPGNLEGLEGAADVAGEDPEVGAGEGVGVSAVLEGVEVALWRAGAARVEFAVAV
jgi:hypothetical protein